MDTRPSQPFDKDIPPPPPPRPPLITPSLSPPGSRVFRIPDRPPPSKRLRLSSTPSGSVSRRTTPAQTPDLRLDSSSRLFAFWDQLAARYNKPVDEDDIVDLRGLDIVKDRGVTRAIEKPYEIGFLADVARDADADDRSSQGVGTGEETPLEDDDSADELDLISPPAVEAVKEKLQYYKNWYVPPADEQDPEDAEAFREFEEAERQRRELYGDFEDEEGDFGTNVTEKPMLDEAVEEDALNAEETDERPGHPEPPVEDETEDEEVEQLPPASTAPLATPQRRKSRPPSTPIEDDSSEDELAKWEIDDTPVPPRRSVAPPDDIIDLTESRSPSPVPPPRGRSRSRPRTQSHAPAARSQSQPGSRAKSKPRQQKRPVTPPRSLSPPKVLQLLTPPRSSCSAPDNPPPVDNSPVRDETPSPKMPRPRPRFVPKLRSPMRRDKEAEDDHPVASPPRACSSPEPMVQATQKGPRASMKPEVVITASHRTPSRLKTPARETSPDIPLSHTQALRKLRQSAASASPPRTKEKDTANPRKDTSPQPAVTPSAAQRNRPKTRDVSEDSCPPQPKPPRGRKRRRISSFSSPDESPERPDSASTSLRRSPRKRALQASVRSSGYSSDVAPPTSSPVQSDGEDEYARQLPSRSHSRPRSEAPIPPPPLYPPMYPHTLRQHGHGNAAPLGSHLPHPHPAYSPTAAHHSQALAWVSYLIASGALPPPPPPPPVPPPPPDDRYHPGQPFSLYALPYSPARQAYPPRQTHGFHTPSSEAGPSRTSAYSTPTHYPHPYPYWFDPAYSNSTLPPSSPIPSSPLSSSPVLRPASVPPGQRSQARGRRVSFKLDADDRPLSATPSRSDPIEGDSSCASDEQPRTHGRRENAPAKPSKGKGKARAVSPSEEVEGDGDGKETAERVDPDRGRPPPRARTPAPPVRREHSVRCAATGKEKASARKK